MTSNSIVELEQQINLLADAAFAATDEIDLDSLPRVDQEHGQRTSRKRTMIMAAMAAGVVAVLGVLSLRQGGEQGFDVASPTEIVLTNPLDIDLADAIALSDQRRLGSIGPQLTVDFDQLPEGWEAETFSLGTVDSGYLTPPEGPVFWHQLEITRPDGPSVVINVQGALDWNGELVYTSPSNSDRGKVEVRGQPGIRTLGSVRWVEQDQVVVEILGKGTTNDFDTEILAVAEALVFTEQNLDWYKDPRGNVGSGLPLVDLDPSLAGRLTGVEWRIIVPKEDAVLIVEPSFRDTGGLPYTEPASYEDVNISIDPFQEGVLVWGNTPTEVTRVRLLTQNSVVVLPTVSLGLDRRLFAVPIDDRLDPIRLEFLDSNGLRIGEFDLSDLIPYSIGGTGTGTSIDPQTGLDGD